MNGDSCDNQPFFSLCSFPFAQPVKPEVVFLTDGQGFFQGGAGGGGGAFAPP